MQLTIDVDNQTYKKAGMVANEKGISVNEMFAYYLKWMIWNEPFLNLSGIKENITQIPQSEKWEQLEQFLEKNRFDLPKGYKFNREELYDRQNIYRYKLSGITFRGHAA